MMHISIGGDLEDIYLNRRKQKMFIVFIRYIAHLLFDYSSIFLIHK